MSWKRRLAIYWKQKHNKILAVGFAALGMACLIGYYVSGEIISGWRLFRNDPWEIWNLVISLVTYSIILVCNIRNDSVAYHGIAMFVFYVSFSAALNFIRDTVTNLVYADYGQAAGIILDVLYGLLLGATAVIGILLYVWTFRYMSGRYVPWGRIRAFAIIFACLLAVKAGFYTYLLIASRGTGEWMWFMWYLFFLPASEMLIAISIIFTLERLRRV